MMTGVVRCACGHKFIAEVTLSKTGGTCPKCGALWDDSYRAIKNSSGVK